VDGNLGGRPGLVQLACPQQVNQGAGKGCMQQAALTRQ
jgi:hypothetical protein